MRVHFIAIGGAVMHNLAIALKQKGYLVTGSDDEIFEPSRSRLAEHGILPEESGWHPEKLTKDIDTVILGMHAREDNPELVMARRMGIDIKSFPEYLYEQTKDKKRIIVAGSHGKTTVTAMIMHVFKTLGMKFDYMVGSQIEGFDTMVGLSGDSEFAVFEGDEYLTSPIDRRPKFHLYKPDIAIINGIAWDHMNVFPTFENYVDQFRIFIEKISEGGTLLYCDIDPVLRELVIGSKQNVIKIPYSAHPFAQSEEGFFLEADGEKIPIKIFGEHNMLNISAAMGACKAVGINETDFYDAIGTFTGTAKRLQKIAETENGIAFLDFAHSPSKVKATVEAVAARYPQNKIIACLELHTFSSLNSSFLPQYHGTLAKADFSYVYYSKHALKLKKLPSISKSDVKKGFGDDNVRVFDDARQLFDEIKSMSLKKPVFLFMSSGSYDGQDIVKLAQELLR
jgi:UDP-N-acetylmuramate: L-alanyl-gamma-D-glutamyl-meso-diaminopimelate ligase